MSGVENDATKYSGWANYETWAVKLWLDNEEGSHRYWQNDQAAELYRAAVVEQLDEFEFEPGDDPAAKIDRQQATVDAADELAARLRTELDDEAETPKAVDGTMYADLLNAALGEVDWDEIATAFVEDLDRDEIEQEQADEVRVEPEEPDEDEDAAA